MIIYVDGKLCCHVGNCFPAMVTAFWFLKIIIIISMLNFIACVAVNEITVSLCHSIKFDYDFLIMKWIPNKIRLD